MAFTMIGLATAALVLLAVSGSRAVLTEWIPTALMAAAMTLMALAPEQTMWMAAGFIASALLFAAGRPRLFAAHRGFAALAMACTPFIHLPGPEPGAHSHGLGGAGSLIALTAAAALGALVLGVVALRSSRAATVAVPGVSAEGRPMRAGAGDAGARTRREQTLHAVEVALMMVMIAVMLLPM
jgi:hypothetical protein